MGAEELRVKGLTQNQSSKKTESSYSAPPPKPAAPRLPDREPAPPPKRSRPAPIIQSSQHSLPLPEDDDIQEVVPVKSEPREALLVQQHQAQPAGQEMYSHALQAAEGDYGAEEQYEDYVSTKEKATMPRKLAMEIKSIWSKTECWIILRSTPCVEQMKVEPDSGLWPLPQKPQQQEPDAPPHRELSH